MAACGAYHTTAVSEEGDLWTWGKGDDGALGHNTRDHKLTPLRISHAQSFAGSRVVMSAAGSCKSAPGSGAPGSFHSAAVTEDGGVWTWGEGVDGRLGHGNEEDRLQPSKLGVENFAGNPVYMVACGGSHTAALAVGGRLWTWGSGFLGHNDKIKRLVPTRVEGAEYFSRARIATVAVGTAHTIAATTEGDVYTWGRGKYGRLGHGDEEDRSVLNESCVDQLYTAMPCMYDAVLYMHVCPSPLVQCIAFSCFCNPAIWRARYFCKL